MKSFMRTALYITIAAALVQVHGQQMKRAEQTPQAKDSELQAMHPTEEIVQPRVLSKNDLFSQDHTADIVAIESVWSAYVYYNDSHNGPDLATLFTDDAIIHFVWNNHGKLEPTFGPNPTETPDGPKGEGCILRGHKEFATYFGFNRTKNLPPEYKNGLPLPGPSHHVSTNKMVKIYDNGTAMLTAVWIGAGTDMKSGPRIGGTGSYRIFFRKTANEGWKIAEFYGVSDKPSSTENCDLHGPLPRPEN